MSHLTSLTSALKNNPNAASVLRNFQASRKSEPIASHSNVAYKDSRNQQMVPPPKPHQKDVIAAMTTRVLVQEELLSLEK
jgi:hypothetical protein